MNTTKCRNCFTPVSAGVHKFSMDKFGVCLCQDCQTKLQEPLSMATEEAKFLYFALKWHQVPAELEKWDGHKHIDIAVPKAKLNIEVDGSHHNTDLKQTLADLKRTYHSFKKGYFTLRIPNTLLYGDYNILDEVIALICEITEIAATRNKPLPKKSQPTQQQGLLGKLLHWLSD